MSLCCYVKNCRFFFFKLVLSIFLFIANTVFFFWTNILNVDQFSWIFVEFRTKNIYILPHHIKIYNDKIFQTINVNRQWNILVPNVNYMQLLCFKDICTTITVLAFQAYVRNFGKLSEDFSFFPEKYETDLQFKFKWK